MQLLFSYLHKIFYSLTPPAFVSNFLYANGYDRNPNLLIIAENYPHLHFNGYFYRSLIPIIGLRLPSFTKEVFTNFGIPMNAKIVKYFENYFA